MYKYLTFLQCVKVMNIVLMTSVLDDSSKNQNLPGKCASGIYTIHQTSRQDHSWSSDAFVPPMYGDVLHPISHVELLFNRSLITPRDTFFMLYLSYHHFDILLYVCGSVYFLLSWPSMEIGRRGESHIIFFKHFLKPKN